MRVRKNEMQVEMAVIQVLQACDTAPDSWATAGNSRTRQGTRQRGRLGGGAAT
jgi:hypothetical protein